eukprot:jgi/Botrbrau1/22033/Bobra.0024s0046.1
MASPNLGQLSEYEQKRLELIARNRARLIALGVQSAVDSLTTLQKPQQNRSTKPRAAPRPKAPAQASRHFFTAPRQSCSCSRRCC